MAALLLHPGIYRPRSRVNSLLPAARVPEGRRSVPHPRVELVSDEIRAVWQHPAPGFLAEIVNTDRMQDAVSDLLLPVLAVVVGPSPTRRLCVLAKSWPSSLH